MYAYILYCFKVLSAPRVKRLIPNPSLSHNWPKSFDNTSKQNYDTLWYKSSTLECQTRTADLLIKLSLFKAAVHFGCKAFPASAMNNAFEVNPSWEVCFTLDLTKSSKLQVQSSWCQRPIHVVWVLHQTLSSTTHTTKAALRDSSLRSAGVCSWSFESRAVNAASIHTL